MAITRINDPPFIIKSHEEDWEFYDAGKRSYGLYKGYNLDTISAANLGLKTIHGALISKQTVNKVLKESGSVINRGSNANNLQIFLASGGTAFGTFAYFFVDAWGH